MKFEPAAAVASVERLAKKHKITVHWRSDGVAESHINTRQVWAKGIIDVYSYLEALHELGHIASPDARRYYERGRTLTCEAAAWEWALFAADPEVVYQLPAAARRKIGLAWVTYVDETLD